MFDKDTLQQNKAYLEGEIARMKMAINNYQGDRFSVEFTELVNRRIELGKRHQKVLHALAEQNRQIKKKTPHDYFRDAAREILDKPTYLTILDYAADLAADDETSDQMLRRAEAMV